MRASLGRRVAGESGAGRTAPTPRSRQWRRSALLPLKFAASAVSFNCLTGTRPLARSLMPVDESSEAASVVLRHSSDTEPGISRKRIGEHWAYFAHDGSRITDRAEIDRLNAVGLPPAYTDAW